MPGRFGRNRAVAAWHDTLPAFMLGLRVEPVVERADPMRLYRQCRAMVSADGYRVEQITVQRSLRRPPRQALRITWRGYYVADCTTVLEAAEHVDLASLEPATW